MLRTCGLAIMAMLVLANAAAAQDDPKIGISMGAPASLGLVWQLTDRVALRPEISLNRTDGESRETLAGLTALGPGGVTSTTETSITTTSWQVAAGVSALFYLAKNAALRPYVSPRWVYSKTSNTGSISGTSPGTFTGGGISTNLVSGSFGAQYALARRFSVFGETGLSFSHGSNSPTSSSTGDLFVSSSTTTANSVSLRGSAGVIFYF